MVTDELEMHQLVVMILDQSITNFYGSIGRFPLSDEESHSRFMFGFHTDFKFRFVFEENDSPVIVRLITSHPLCTSKK